MFHRFVIILVVMLLIIFILPMQTTLADSPPTLPAGQLNATVQSFPQGQTYPVYSAPSQNSLRSNKGKALVSTDDWIQVFGRTEDWLLIQYGIADSEYRIGYIQVAANPSFNALSELCFHPVELTLQHDINLTDDPLGKNAKLCTIPANTKVEWLSSLGSRWAYLSAELNGQPVRGFVPVWDIRADCTSVPKLSPGLFAAMGENGLWGFIDVHGQFVIEPIYDFADGFYGQYGMALKKSPEDVPQWCIIDQNGVIAYQSQYEFDQGYDGYCYGGVDTGILQVSNGEECGWFDLQTGYCSIGTGWELSTPWLSNSPLAFAFNRGQYGWVRVDTGEVLPTLLTPDMLEYLEETNTTPLFHDGYAELFTISHLNTNDIDKTVEDTWWFVDETGHMCMADASYHSADRENENYCGLAVAVNHQTGKYGYLSMQTGKVVIKAAYKEAYPFSSYGYACVRFDQGDYGHIDREGNVMARGFTCPYTIMHGYAWLDKECQLINAAGEKLLKLENNGWEVALSLDTPDSNLGYADKKYVYPGGILILLFQDQTTMDFIKLDGTFLLEEHDFSYDFRYEPCAYCFFSDDRLVLQKKSTQQYGVIDLEGHQVVDFQYNFIGHYRNGLAYFEFDNQCGYLSLDGQVVYCWNKI